MQVNGTALEWLPFVGGGLGARTRPGAAVSFIAPADCRRSAISYTASDCVSSATTWPASCDLCQRLGKKGRSARLVTLRSCLPSGNSLKPNPKYDRGPHLDIGVEASAPTTVCITLGQPNELRAEPNESRHQRVFSILATGVEQRECVWKRINPGRGASRQIKVRTFSRRGMCVHRWHFDRRLVQPTVIDNGTSYIMELWVKTGRRGGPGVL